MKQTRTALVASLAREAATSPGQASIRRSAAIWLVSGWAIVVAAMLVRAPMRPGFVTQLATSPHFLIESLTGLSAGVLLLFGCLQLGVPSPTSSLKRTIISLLVTATWVGFYILAQYHPALEPSMLGKREGCEYETFLLSLPLILTGLLTLHGFAPLNRWYSGAILGASAGAIPALLMQFACMYVPTHILTNHIAPIAGSMIVGAILGPLVLRKI